MCCSHLWFGVKQFFIYIDFWFVCRGCHGLCQKKLKLKARNLTGRTIVLAVAKEETAAVVADRAAQNLFETSCLAANASVKSVVKTLMNHLDSTGISCVFSPSIATYNNRTLVDDETMAALFETATEAHVKILLNLQCPDPKLTAAYCRFARLRDEA